MEQTKEPQFLRFCIPIVETLQELGGSGQPKEVTDMVLERLHISEREQAQTLKNGGSRVRNQAAWARFYLAKADWLGCFTTRCLGADGKGAHHPPLPTRRVPAFQGWAHHGPTQR
jgi:restriction system protein